MLKASSHLVQLSLIGSSQNGVEGSDRASWDQYCLYVLSDVVDSPWRALVLDLDVLLRHKGSSDSVDDQLQWQNKSDRHMGRFTSCSFLLTQQASTRLTGPCYHSMSVASVLVSQATGALLLCPRAMRCPA